MEIVKIAIENIKPYEKNAKLHPKEQIEQIKKSIQEFGMNDPIAVWGSENIIVEGHGRLEALKELGYKEVDCIRLDHLSDDERKAYALAHNKLTMNSDFDFDILNDELLDIQNIDMRDFGFDIDVAIEEKEVIDDKYDVDINLPKQANSKRGQIYKLGNHRLMCGDSTNISDVHKLMNERVADLLFTDPPYNVDIENSDGLKIENDNMSSQAFRDFLNDAFYCASQYLKEGGAFYVWHSDAESVNFRESLKENGLIPHECLIWVKNSFTFGRLDYKYKHEPCLYGWKEGAGHYFVDQYNLSTIIEKEIDIDHMKKEELQELAKKLLQDQTPTTIIRGNKPLKNDLHPTMKPLIICGDLIRNSSRQKEIVLDLFGGSGSTLIACEQLDRICYMMEYDPKYVDVIIDRWEKNTGKKAELLNES